jgi:hypothetical protein
LRVLFAIDKGSEGENKEGVPFLFPSVLP